MKECCTNMTYVPPQAPAQLCSWENDYGFPKASKDWDHDNCKEIMLQSIEHWAVFFDFSYFNINNSMNIYIIKFS